MTRPAQPQSKPSRLEPDRLRVSTTTQPQSKLRRNRRVLLGFTLIELLIGMVILGVILLAASSLLQGNQKLTGETQTRSNALGDARGAISRITETISQAAYIYPENTVITVNNGLVGMGVTNEIKTGPDAIAVLISDGNVPAMYKGVIYYLANRAAATFAADLPQLPADRIAQLVLVEAQTTTNMAWVSKSTPLPNWTVDATEGVLVDGVDGDDTLTKLMDSVQFAPTSSYDPGPLISSVGYSVGIRVATSGKTLANSGTTVLRGLTNARNVPRR